MSVLSGKKILLGISGGIAAYKTALLVRLFIKAGAQVQVVMTPAAKDFVTPLTLATLSNNPVYSSFVGDDDDTGVWNNHVALALWADIMLIAPATANTLAKMAHGNCDNLLLATYLSAKCPVYFAPAMDLDMYKHPSTLDSFQKLKEFGHLMIPAESGFLASGLEGEGRMAAPENIISFISNDMASKLPLTGKKFLITAGPTYEPIDPVRFIGNHSSGIMGYEIATAAQNLGAVVTLISGPSQVEISNKNIHLIKITTAQEMFEACKTYFDDTDVFIAAAAVADYKPQKIASQKIKKQENTYTITLEKNVDILATLAQNKKRQFVVGFALETENEMEHAKAKLERKNLDLIVLNSLNDKGAGFGKSTNKITFIDANHNVDALPLKSKKEVAQDIINKVISFL
jgi:phosphopantothenoylcysteine decarboxylase / phosphopantothenate---cysteine ligase